MQVKSICWWLVGPEYWAADLLDENSIPVRGKFDEPETGATGLTATATLEQAKLAAIPKLRQLAIEYGVSPFDVHFDQHESEQYSEYYSGVLLG